MARKAEKAAKKVEALNTLEAVARAWLEHGGDAWAARTRSLIVASLENHVFPALGAKPIAAIQPADIRHAVKAIEAGGAAELAGRMIQRLRSVFRYAIAHALIATDPTYPLKPAEIFKPRKVEHRAALAEKDVPAFLHRLADFGGTSTISGSFMVATPRRVPASKTCTTSWDITGKIGDDEQPFLPVALSEPCMKP